MKYFNEYIVNTNQLIDNLNIIKSQINTNTKFCAVVKGNAYGLGVKTVCESLKGKVDFFAVACLTEALKIREFDKETKILILGLVDIDDLNICNEKNISISIGDNEYLYKVKNTNISIHLQVNTGLNRFGYKTITEFKKALKYIDKNNLCLEGVYSHFATKFNDVNFINKQFFRFWQYKNLVKNNNVIFHISNSFAITLNNGFNLDMVRSGFLLYGQTENKIGCKPILEIKSKIIHVFTAKRGETIGYDRTYKLTKNTKIGVIPIGYADGLNRKLSNKFYVLIKGCWCKIVGLICMDVFMVELSNVNVDVGDEVVILGKSGNNQITLQDYAKILDTTAYEVMLKFNYNRMNYLIKK
jgi:alanine racemase